MKRTLVASWVVLLGCTDTGGPAPSDMPDGISDPTVDAPDTFEASDPDAPDSPSADLPTEPEGPPVIRLTVNALPPEMDGSTPYFDGGEGPFDFVLTLPTWDFTLDLFIDREPSFLALDTLDVTCDSGVGDGEPARALGERFAPYEGHLRWLVPEDAAFARGRVTCRAEIESAAGEGSNRSEITFDTAARTAELHPFEPVDFWLVTFTRDLYTVDPLAADLAVTSTPGSDGVPDFLQDLALVGLQGDESGRGAATVEARGQVGVNAIVADWIIDDTMEVLRGLYGVSPVDGSPTDSESVQIVIYREGDVGAPVPPFDGSFSIHGVGGEPAPNRPAQFGRSSHVDQNNRSAQDDGQDTYGSFTTNIMRTILSNPAASLLFGELLPVGGLPIGAGDIDAQLVVDDFEPSDVSVIGRRRREQLTFEIELLSKALGSLIAHEMGHSVGLVPCAIPPYGLFSGTFDDRFMASDPGCGHIDTPGLNVMQTGASFLENPTELFGEVAFGPLNAAYLRGRLLVLPE